MCPHDGDDRLHTGRSFANAAVLVYTHTDGSCSNATEVRTISWTDHKLIWWCSIHHSRSQMSIVRAMTITADSLLPRLKYGCNGGYDVAVKGLSVVVSVPFSFPHGRRSISPSLLPCGWRPITFCSQLAPIHKISKANLIVIQTIEFEMRLISIPRLT